MRRSPYAPLAGIMLLSAWLGVAIFVAVVIAPAAFAVLPTRALAGALVGQALPVLFMCGLVIGAGVVALYPTMTRAVRIGGLLLLGGSAAAMMIERRLHSLLTSVGAPIDTLASTDPTRVQFGRLHAFSVLMMGVGAVGATVSLFALARRLHSDASPQQSSLGSDATSASLAPSPSAPIT